MTLNLDSFDACIDRFEDAWGANEVPLLGQFLLPESHADYRRLLHELTKIDMEYRWRRHPPSDVLRAKAFVESYARAYPGLLDQQGDMPIELIAEEYRIRRRWGDNPAMKSFVERFPTQASEVVQTLESIDAELSTRRSFLDHRRDAIELLAHGKNAVNADLVLDRHTLTIGMQVDDFRLLGELGRGAFARVFLAQQVSMQRLVALKVSDHKSLESPVLSQLEHSNIVRVFDERSFGSMYLMYMQYVPGGTLRDVMDDLAKSSTHDRNGHRFLQTVRDNPRFDNHAGMRVAQSNSIDGLDWPSTVAWIGARLADALAHAHGLGVRHRDVKPENILLTPDGEPMLVDFNLSFGATVHGAKVDKAFGGSLAYMSPEHLHVLLGDSSAEMVDASSDIYSLGIVLHELLLGYRPFEVGRDSMEATGSTLEHLRVRENAIFHHQPAKATGNDDGDLYSYIAQCLSFQKSERPASAAHVARRLQQLSIPSIRKLLVLKQGTWIEKATDHPIAWYLALGMLPNVCLSPLNIWANHRIAIQNFDLEFFHRWQEPIVNLVEFPAGMAMAWWMALPIAEALKVSKREGGLEESSRALSARRCLRLPAATAAIVLGLWSLSGVVFPAWNQWASASRVDTIGFFGFFLSQFLHGLIAACFSLVCVCYVVLRAFYVRLISRDASDAEHQQLGKLDRQLGWANAGLEVTPLFSLLAISLSDHIDQLVFVVLAIVGFIGHLVASILIPQLRATIRSLQLSLRPTETLLRYREQS